MSETSAKKGPEDTTSGDVGPHFEGGPPRLLDLIGLDTLQSIQDGFSNLVGVPASIRDNEGNLITRPSGSNRFCEILGGAMHGLDECRQSNAEAVRKAAGQRKPIKYVCYSGLAQYAAAIELDGHILGTIVLGDMPEKPLEEEQVRRIARSQGVDEEELWRAAQELAPWQEEAYRNAIQFLQLLAETLARICYQQAALKKRLEELVALSETSDLLTSTLDPDTVLDNIVETMAEVMHVKACSLRLLTESSEELVIKAAYGMSPAYLKKGPVLVSENPLDQRALAGEVIQIKSMAEDPHVRYRAEAEREGLVSSLAIGLISKGRPLGTLHIYTDHLHQFSEDELRMFRAIASQAATAVDNARLVSELVQRRQTDYELQLAGEVQQRMLPRQTPQIPGYETFGLMVPCRQVAGDYYDYIELAGGLHWGLAIGDVAGKGVPAAILMASVRSSLQAQVRNLYDVEDIIRRVNEQLCADTFPEEFMTLFYAVLDTRSHRLTYVNAGHEPPVVIRGGTVKDLDTGGPLLGVIPKAQFQKGIVELESGDCLVLYTDGVVDMADYDGKRFGRKRFIQHLLDHSGESAERIVNELLWDIRRFAGLAPRTDDLSIIVLKML